ncbi:MAG: outer membrane beta-barrel protein, partial [Pseudomonadota bacterium]
MKFAKITAAAAAIAMIGGTAMAQDGQAYVGIGVDAVEFDSYNLSGKAGYNFNDFFGVEAQGGFGIIDQEETIAGIDIDAGIDYYVSGFLTGRIPMSEQFELIGRVGYYFGEVGGTAAGIAVSEDVDGLAVGAGAQFNF